MPTFVESAEALIRTIGKQELSEYFWKRLRAAKDATFRPQLIGALSRLAGAEAFEFLCKLALDDDEDLQSRISAARGIASSYESAQDSPEVSGRRTSLAFELLRLLDHPSEDLRSVVAITLVRVGMDKPVLRRLKELGLPSLNAAATKELEKVEGSAGELYFERLTASGVVLTRTGELNGLRQALRRHGIVALVGAPGTGKTTLARQLLESEAYDFKIWLSSPRTVNEISSEIAGTLGQGRSLEVRDATERIIGTCKGAKVLIIIDDYEFAEDDVLGYLTMLADVAGANIILAGRLRPTAQNLTTIVVGPLSSEESRRLLDKMISPVHKRVPDEVLDVMIAKSEGNPLFLRMMAEYLKEGRDPYQAMEDLSRPEPLRHVLDQTMSRLGVEELRVLQILGQCDSTVVREDVVRALFANEVVGPKLDFPDVVQRLSSMALLRTDDEGLMFSHLLIREYVNSTTDSRTVVRLNAELAAYYSGLGDEAQANVYRTRAKTTPAV